MKLKSLLIAATMVGGIALGASAANAQVDVYSVTGSSSAFNGSFDFSAPVTEFNLDQSVLYTAFNGKGAYAGITNFSFTGLGSIGYATEALYFDNNLTNYIIGTPTLNSAGTEYVGAVISAPGGTFTISAAPEPGVWALMIAGVAMIGSALRFSRKQNGALAVA